jgi:excisionase family DNA binding protein
MPEARTFPTKSQRGTPMAKQIKNPEPDVKLPLETVAETAEHFGVSERTIWRWIAAGELPCVRKGRIVRIRPKDRETLIRRHLS